MAFCMFTRGYGSLKIRVAWVTYLSDGLRQRHCEPLDCPMGWKMMLESYPLVMTNIAIEHGQFIVDLPIKNGDVP